MACRRLLFTALAALALLAFTTGRSSAIVFATFHQTSAGLPFSYSNATGTFSETATVDFSFLALAPGSPFTTSGVTFSLTGNALTPVGGSPLEQAWAATFSFTKAGVNYLSGTITGTASVAPGSNVGGYSGSELTFDTVSYTSDFIPTFQFPRSFSWSVESLPGNPWGATGPNAANYVDFTASVNGSFGAEAAVVPEPGMLSALLGVGVAGSLFAWRRRRA